MYICLTNASNAPERFAITSGAAILLLQDTQERGARVGRDQWERNLDWPSGLTDTGRTQATEVGRNYSGAFKPDQERGPKSRAPNSGYGPELPARTDSD